MSTIILGITGSIAAHKSADIASRLTKLGHDVHCVCTAMALDFVTPSTLLNLSRRKVFSSFDDEAGQWPPLHIDLARRADLFVVAPATANTIAQMAHGLAPNVLTSAYLAYRGNVLVCPAMNTMMWDHPATQQNIQTLATRPGHLIFGPDDEGTLACGDPGKGRMMPVEKIVECIVGLLDAGKE